MTPVTNREVELHAWVTQGGPVLLNEMHEEHLRNAIKRMKDRGYVSERDHDLWEIGRPLRTIDLMEHELNRRALQQK